MRPPATLPKRLPTPSLCTLTPSRRLIAHTPSLALPPQYNRSRQGEPFPPILSPFQNKVLSIPKDDPNGGWTVEDPRRQRSTGSTGGGGGGRGGPGGGGGKIEFTGRQKLVGVGLVGSGVYYLVHLEKVPETGRLRFIDTSEASERSMGKGSPLLLYPIRTSSS
jgi:hypothetical protein